MLNAQEKQQEQEQEQEQEQQQQKRNNLSLNDFNFELLQRRTRKEQKKFGKKIYVCYIPKKQTPLQLNSLSYDVQVNNGVATYNMSLSYRNPTQEPADVEFLFSVPPNSVIIKLEVQIGDKRVLALIKEKKEAISQFNQGIQDGKTMLYSEQNEHYPDIIKAKLGNLGPKENILITYQYIEQLQVQVNEFWRLCIDPVVNPRYNQSQQNYLRNLFNINQFDYNYVQDIKVTINMELIYVKSPTHQILIQKQDVGTFIKLNNQQQQDNKNQDPKNTFVLIFQNKNIHDPLILLTHTNNDQLQHQKYCATIQFIPKFNPLQLDDAYQAYQETNDNESNIYEFNAKGEYIFVIDRSGSMEGLRILKAKQALKLFLQSLPVNSYYNIVSFGSEGKRQYKQSLKYNQNSVEKTLNELQQFDADMGGTEIRIVQINGYSRNIFILTDGEVDPEPVLEVISQSVKADLRFYSLGIGNGCSQYMIEKIAFLGNGLHHIVADDEDLNQKVIDLLQDSITPYFQQFDFETNLPNQSLIVTNRGGTQRYYFNLTYYDENMKQYGLHSEIDQKKSMENDNYHKLAVGKEIQQIFQNARLKQLQFKNNYGKSKIIYKQNIIDLSLTYQILSPYTAFVCEVVELQDDIKQKLKEKVIIQFYEEKIMCKAQHCSYQAAGWLKCLSCIKSLCLGVHAYLQRKDSEITRENPSQNLQIQTEQFQIDQKKIEQEIGQISLQYDIQNTEKVNKINYLDIINKFNLDGSIQENIINLLKFNKEDFQLQIPFELQLLIATLALLEIQFKEQKDSWILVFNKGVKYLKQNNIIYKQMKNEVIQMLKLDRLIL